MGTVIAVVAGGVIGAGAVVGYICWQVGKAFG